MESNGITTRFIRIERRWSGAGTLKVGAVLIVILSIALGLQLWAQPSGARISLPVDRRRIQGDWYEHQVFTADGPSPRVAAGALHFDGRTTFSRSGMPAGFYGVTAWKTPSQITLDYRSGPWKGVMEGVCKFVGDRRTLVICFGDPRPTDFTLPKGSGRSLHVYKRQPQKAGD
jgi:hypothetical protein